MDKDFLEIFNVTGGAVAVIRDGAVVWISDHAGRLGLKSGMAARSFLPEGVEPSSLDGVRMLSLPALGSSVRAQICPCGDLTVLVLDDGEPTLSYDAIGQIRRILSEPVDDILFTARPLFERLEELEDPDIQARTARLNRSFFRLLRMSAALTDLQGSARTFSPERLELRRWLKEMEQRLGELVSAAGRTPVFILPERPVFVSADAGLLEQSILGLLSNAIRYSPAGSTVTLHVQEQNGQCLFTVRNPVDGPISLTDLAGSFTRPVDAGDRHGLGLGLHRVRNAAGLHGGVLLLECLPTGEFSAVMRIPCDRAPETLRVSPVQVDRSGGFSRMLIELSDVLPDDVYDSRNF